MVYHNNATQHHRVLHRREDCGGHKARIVIWACPRFQDSDRDYGKFSFSSHASINSQNFRPKTILSQFSDSASY